MSLAFIITTVPDQATADKIANAMIDESLAACVHILPPHQSIYKWQGKVEKGSEINLIIKAPAGQYKQIEQRILELHPYEVPFIGQFQADQALEAYLGWAKNQIK